MTLLVIGLILFLGAHSARIVADAARTRVIAKWGEGAWQGLYSLLSVAGITAIVIGYASARHASPVLWTPITGMHHLAAVLTLAAFILLVAANVPGNAFKARLHHPMVLAIWLWSLAHLLANHTLASTLLFGSFLLWATCNFIAARRRDRLAGTVYPQGKVAATVITVVVGAAAWAVMVFWLHEQWLGVSPLG